uniref:G_PROTEIN_RECEP_F1_2 domain-containing protein n=1 Tax=Panagrellus redivivus TaxID=6233 RepID=A0A7E4ULY8_PANRE
MGTTLVPDGTGASPVAYVLHWPPDEITITTTTAKPSLPDIYETAPNIGALLLLPLLCAIGFIGNAMVCIAIATDRRLQNITNYFLFSLALADLLVCSIVMPLAILAEARHGYWTWSFAMCFLYAYSDVFLCSASIVHMSVISLDRYLGISQPLKMRNKSRTVVFMKVALVWVITLMISSPIAALAIHDPRNILHDNQCAITNRGYMLYGSTLSFLIPLGIMVATYINTTKLLNKQASLLSQRTNDRFHNGLRRTLPHRKLGYVRTGSYGANSTAKESTNQHKTSTLSYASLNAGTPGTPANRSNRNAKYGFQQLRTNSSSTETEDTQLILNGEPVPPPGKKLEKQSSVLKLQFGRLRDRTSSVLNTISTKVGRRSSLQTESMELANEHKATRVLAVVFICFFICWTPFFCSNITLGILGNEWAVPSWMGSLFLWLGYISSIINPIIYTIFNRRFRQAFLRILRCQCMHSARDPSLSYSRTHTYMPTEAHTWSNFEGKASNNNSCKEGGNGRAYTPPGSSRQPVTGLLSVCATRAISTSSANATLNSPGKAAGSPFRQAVMANAKTRPLAFPVDNGNTEQRQGVTFSIEQTSYSTPNSPVRPRKLLDSIKNSASSSSCRSKPTEGIENQTPEQPPPATASQTMQISDYDNLKSEISERAKSSSVERAATSSISENDDEHQPLINAKHSSTSSTPKKGISPSTASSTTVPKRFLLSANINNNNNNRNMPRSVSATMELRPASATPYGSSAIKSTVVTEHRPSWSVGSMKVPSGIHRSPSAGTEGGFTITNNSTTTTSSNGRLIRAHKIYETYL